MSSIQNQPWILRRVMPIVGILIPLMLVVGSCTTDAKSPDKVTPTQTSVAAPSSTPSSDSGTTTPAPVGPVDADQAGKIATDAYGGTVKSVESDSYQGIAAWEVEVRDSNQGRIEVKVAKDTGKILLVEQDD